MTATMRTNFLKPLAIGKVKLDNNLILAPMAGISDGPFRMLARAGGAGMTCSEMVSAKALQYGHTRTRRMIAINEAERPVSMQIFGPDPKSMSESAKTVEESGADVIDINFGCPVPKIAKSGAGAVLLSNEALAADIMEAVAKSVKIPVTAKIRIGRNAGENIAPKFVKTAAECGISAVIIHGRPASAGHKGSPDLEAIRQAKEASPIPVIGNGGITDELTAMDFFEQTGCDGIMIGRGAIGDFEIFNRTAHYIQTGERLSEPTWEDRINNFKKHARLSAQLYGEKFGLIRMRKIVAYYLKDMPNASAIRNSFCQMETLEDMDALLSNALKSPHFD